MSPSSLTLTSHRLHAIDVKFPGDILKCFEVAATVSKVVSKRYP